MSGEGGLVRMEPGTISEFTGFRNPEQVLMEAQKAATALKKIVDAKLKKVVINNEVYLEIEDWLTVGSFFGHTVKIAEDRFIDYGKVQGFEARAVVLDPGGNEVSSAWAMCLNDEDKWGMRSKYEWKDELDANGKKIWIAPSGGKKGHYKAVKVKVGEEPTPLFQLRSMAGTRAASKALSLRFRWVVVLAGYKPTPAEEVDDNTIGAEVQSEKERAEKEGISEPKKKETGTDGKEKAGLVIGESGIPAAKDLGMDPPPAVPGEEAPRASEPQIKAIGTIFGKLGIKDDAERHVKTAKILGVGEMPSFREMGKEQASYTIRFLDAWSSKVSAK